MIGHQELMTCSLCVLLPIRVVFVWNPFLFGCGSQEVGVGVMGAPPLSSPLFFCHVSLYFSSTNRIMIKENEPRGTRAKIFLFAFALIFIPPSSIGICVRARLRVQGEIKQRRGKGSFSLSLPLSVCMCASEQAPRDLTLLFKPSSYHGAGCLIWLLKSKSKESGLRGSARTHKHTHTERMWRISHRRDAESLTPQGHKATLTITDPPEALQQIQTRQSSACLCLPENRWMLETKVF